MWLIRISVYQDRMGILTEDMVTRTADTVILMVGMVTAMGMGKRIIMITTRVSPMIF